MNYENRIILIYKRTHKGDPNSNGVFGEHDCMGIVRDRKFTDVIGIGGVKPDTGNEGIAKKINWIGVGATKVELKENRANEVIFDHFCLYEDKGELVQNIAPNLYKYMYLEKESSHRRSIHSTSLPKEALEEAFKILEIAKDCPSSKGILPEGGSVKKCATRSKSQSSCKK